MKLKDLTWEIRLACLLIAVSVIVYAVKFLFFGDNGASNTLSYIFNSLGFLPINILIVTLIINRLLTMRAKREQQEKTRMIIGLFFSEMGDILLRKMIQWDKSPEMLRENMQVINTWTKGQYAAAKDHASRLCTRTVPSPDDLNEIRELFMKNHNFLLRLIENPVLLEHNTISKLLQDLFHLGEELASRDDFHTLPVTDLAHLTGDVNRVYCQLTTGWLEHMEYLSRNYPYLLSLCLRKSPFQLENRVVVTE